MNDISNHNYNENFSLLGGRAVAVPAHQNLGGDHGGPRGVFTWALIGLRTGVDWLERHAPPRQSRWGKILRCVCLLVAAVGIDKFLKLCIPAEVVEGLVRRDMVGPVVTVWLAGFFWAIAIFLAIGGGYI